MTKYTRFSKIRVCTTPLLLLNYLIRSQLLTFDRSARVIPRTLTTMAVLFYKNISDRSLELFFQEMIAFYEFVSEIGLNLTILYRKTVIRIPIFHVIKLKNLAWNLHGYEFVHILKEYHMEVTGKIIEILDEKSGETTRGNWRKQEYVLETVSEYPKKICFVVWGDKIDLFAIKQSEIITVGIDLESREYNGRWYTDVKAWKITRDSSHTISGSKTLLNDHSNDEKNHDVTLDDEIPF